MTLLTRDTQDKVINLLVSEGLANPTMVQEVVDEVAKTKQPLIAALVSKGVITNRMVSHATANVLGVQYIELDNIIIDQDTLLNLPQEISERTLAVALGESNGYLVVAMVDVTNVQSTDYLSTLTGKPVRAVMSSEEGIRNVLSQYRADFSNVDKAVAASNREVQQQQVSEDVKTIVQDSPISKALTTILEFAVKSKASDIHIEPLEEMLVIRCRIDGVLRRVMELPKSVEPALVSRIKILANL